MLRKTPWLAAFLLASVGLSLLAQAQEPGPPAKRSMSLGERLGAFRRSLLGGGEQERIVEPQPGDLSGLDMPSGPRQGSTLGPRSRSAVVTPTQTGRPGGYSSRRRRPGPGGSPGGRVGAVNPGRLGPGSLQERLSTIRDPASTGGTSEIVIPTEDDVRQGAAVGPTGPGQPTVADPGAITPQEPEWPAGADQAAPPVSSRRTVRPAQQPRLAQNPAAAPQPQPTTGGPAPVLGTNNLRPSRPAAPSLEHETLPDAPPQSSAAPAPAGAPATSAAEPPRVAREGDRPNLLISRRSPLLTVDVSGPETVTVGKSSTYVVSVQNSGEVSAQDVVVTVMIPAWADLNEAKPTAGSAANPLSADRDKEADRYEPLEWKLPKLDGKARERLVLKLIPRKSRRFDLAVQWTFSPVTSQALVEVQEPMLEMSLSGPREVFFGEKKIYKLTLANPGTGDAENLTLHVQVGRGQDQSATDRLAVLRAGESKVIELELEARQPGTLAIQAHAAADGGLESELTEEIMVRRAALAVTIEGPPAKFARSEAMYRIHVGNPGNAKAENIQVVAHLPAGAQLTAAGRGAEHDARNNRLGWTLPGLAAQTEQILEFRCMLHEPGENRLRVDAAAAGDLAAVGAAATQVEAIADLKLEVKDPPGAVALGEEVVYELIIRNRGTKQADQVEAFAYFSPGIEPVSVEGSEARIASGEGMVEFAPLGSLPAGTEVVLKVRARADQPGNHVFRGEVVCKPLEIKLAADEITRFYGDEATAVAKQPGDTTTR